MCSSFVMPLCSRLWFSGAQNKPELIPPGRCLLSRWRNCLFVRKKSFEKIWHLSRRSSDHIHTLLLVNTDFLERVPNPQQSLTVWRAGTTNGQIWLQASLPLICWFFGDKLGEKCSATVWDWLRPASVWLHAVSSHFGTKGNWIGLDWCTICEKKRAFFGALNISDWGGECEIENIWNWWWAWRWILNGLDPPEVATAQETPIFGPPTTSQSSILYILLFTHHLTNTRVKISLRDREWGWGAWSQSSPQIYKDLYFLFNSYKESLYFDLFCLIIIWTGFTLDCVSVGSRKNDIF